MTYLKFPKFIDWCDGIYAKKLFIIALALILTFVWPGDGDTRTTRSCYLRIVFVLEQYFTDGRWQVHDGSLRLDAGTLRFSASAPGVSHNKARMRASKKAEKCTRDWWNRDCLAAQFTNYGPEYRRTPIDNLMNQKICRDLRRQHRTDLVGHRLRGTLLGKIDGDRCCLDSSRKCPYRYAHVRTVGFYEGGLAGKQLRGGEPYYVTCE